MKKIYQIGPVPFLITFFVLLNSIPSIIGYLKTPKGMVFLGRIHHPNDYFYYLSQFSQGARSWIWSYDLFTHEYTHPTLIGWTNVLLGHIFSLFGISAIAAYQVCVGFFTALLLLASYLLIKQIITDKTPRIIAFILFLVSNAFPTLTFQSDHWSLSYGDYWFNMGIPFVRLGGVPHQILAQLCTVAIVILALRWQLEQKQRLVRIIGASFVGFTLASINPVQWAEVSFVLFVSICAYLLFQWQKNHIRPTKKSVITLSIIPTVVVVSGLPMAWYLKQLFQTLPYNQLASWEVLQQLHMTLQVFIQANGPLPILALLSLPLFLKNLSFPKLLSITCVVAALIMLFFPIPLWLGLLNVRFIGVLLYIFMACIAGTGIYEIGKKIRIFGHSSHLLIIACIIVILLPTYMLQIQERLKVNSNDSFTYLSVGTMETLAHAARISSLSDNFLVIWPFNVSFPGLTGRRTFHGHPLLTIDESTKDKQSYQFFDGQMSQQDMQDFLKKNSVTYIIAYPWTNSVANLPFVTEVFANNFLEIWKVR